MKKNNKTPKLRFSGYTDDWEQRKLSEISDVRDGTHDSPSYLSDGHPFVTSKNVKDGYINYDDVQYISDEDFEAINKRSKVDMNDILMGMIGTIGNLALIRTEPDFAIKNVALIKDTKQVSYMYLYHYLQSSSAERQLLSGLDGGTQKFVSLKNIRELNIMVPSEAEQLKVGNFIESLDHLITLHQRKLEKLQNMKKSCLQKMFPKDGATVPEIRFSEFQGDWEERTLGSCFDERLESLPDGELLSVTIGSGIKKFSELDRHDNSNTDKSKYKRVCIGDIAYNSMRMWQGASGRSPYEGIVSPAYTVVKPIGDIDTQFFAYMFKKKEIIHLFEINSQGLTSDTWNLKYPAFSKIVVRVPRNVEEQSRIARFLLELDELISCAEQEIEITKRIKKGCLQKMFV